MRWNSNEFYLEFMGQTNLSRYLFYIKNGFGKQEIPNAHQDSYYGDHF